jgi:hypothetical protein
MVFMVLSYPGFASAADSKEVYKQRQDAQRDRQQKKNERNRNLADATRAFRSYTQGLKMDYRERVKNLDTEFQLRRVELNAEHNARVASAEADYQKKVSNLFMNPGGELTDEHIQKMRDEQKAHADVLFELKKQSAEELHLERIASQEKKNALFDEMDKLALDEAKSLGLTDKYAPILATPIGGELTRQEQQWNDREKKEVVRLEERNKKALSEFRNGAELRKWEIGNLNEDFKLTWDKKAKLHALESEQVFLNTLFMQAAQGKEFDQQKAMNKVAEINEKKRLIEIEYKKIRDKNRITRREERKAILGK